jgi:hypothetical protein
MRVLTATGLIALIAVAVGLASGCGSSPSAATGTAPATSTFVLPGPPTGPYDGNHKDAALIAAEAALRNAWGDIKLSQPNAHFTYHVLHPQMPGHPIDPPIYGWEVSFTATDLPDDSESTRHGPPLASMPYPGQMPPAKPELQQTAATMVPARAPAPPVPLSMQPRAQNSTADAAHALPPPLQPGNQLPPGVGPGAPNQAPAPQLPTEMERSLNQQFTNQANAPTAARHVVPHELVLAVFVAVDGSTRLL